MDENLLTFEAVIGSVQYGTPIVVTEEDTLEEMHSGVHDFNSCLHEKYGDRLYKAEVSILSISDGVLHIQIICGDENHD